MSITWVRVLAAAAALAFLSACAGPGYYPISGLPAGPDDPVTRMNSTGYFPPYGI